MGFFFTAFHYPPLFCHPCLRSPPTILAKIMWDIVAECHASTIDPFPHGRVILWAEILPCPLPHSRPTLHMGGWGGKGGRGKQIFQEFGTTGKQFLASLLIYLDNRLTGSMNTVYCLLNDYLSDQAISSPKAQKVVL